MGISRTLRLFGGWLVLLFIVSNLRASSPVYGSAETGSPDIVQLYLLPKARLGREEPWGIRERAESHKL